MAPRIYLVDDDKFLLGLYATKFRNAGYEVETAQGGEALLTILRQNSVPLDAILLDIIMPGLDGFETLAALRKEQLASGAKVIFLSNQGQESDLEKARELHADGYIIKASAIPSEVLAEVGRILNAGAQPAVA